MCIGINVFLANGRILCAQPCIIFYTVVKQSMRMYTEPITCFKIDSKMHKGVVCVGSRFVENWFAHNRYKLKMLIASAYSWVCAEVFTSALVTGVAENSGSGSHSSIAIYHTQEKVTTIVSMVSGFSQESFQCTWQSCAWCALVLVHEFLVKLQTLWSRTNIVTIKFCCVAVSVDGMSLNTGYTFQQLQIITFLVDVEQNLIGLVWAYSYRKHLANTS